MTIADQTNISSGRAWIMLLLASAFEIGYAISVAGSQAFTVASWSIAAVFFFLLTLYFLSVALRVIDVGIGYAVWAGIGATGASVFGALVFEQMLAPIQVFWLLVVIGGVVWLKLTDSPKLQARESGATR